MASFVGNEWFETEQCCKCGIAFAMTSDFQKRRRDDHKIFYCPSGHGQHYFGQSEEQKLKAELERKNQMLDAAQARAQSAEAERLQVTKAHKKMRERVMNGVCPCCSRTFQNLMQHMKSEHPEFAAIKTMLALRTAFAMTQSAVAAEAGVNTIYVSLYERDKPVADSAKVRLDNWIAKHTINDTEAK